jgi:hypothetical protein
LNPSLVESLEYSGVNITFMMFIERVQIPTYWKRLFKEVPERAPNIHHEGREFTGMLFWKRV